jgi:hypothetical protein
VGGELLEGKLKKRKIKFKDNHDNLRWGHIGGGTLLIKETYIMDAEHILHKIDNIWKHVWNLGTWPKVSTFFQLLAS